MDRRWHFHHKKNGGTTPEFETTYFWLYPFVEKEYRLFNPDFSRTTMYILCVQIKVNLLLESVS
jgi:hypothetical protein